jgi:bacteriocin biosynthesis cyclodehydratase domain-containing protein
VVLLGLGGLGSWAALALACCGIGRLRAIDGDVVETGNLNRQVLYRECDVGTAKVDAAAPMLRAFNSALAYEPVRQRLESQRDVEKVIAGADFVIDVADWPPGVIEKWVNGACFSLGIPFLTMSQHPPLIRMGPTYVPGVTGCYLCQEAQLRAQSPLFDDVARYRSTHQSGAATFGPACGLLGSHAALDAVHQISGVCPPASLGAALMVDLRTLEVTRTPIARRRDCPVCATASTRSS